MAAIKNLCIRQVSILCHVTIPSTKFLEPSSSRAVILPFLIRIYHHFLSGHGGTEIYINTYDWSFVATCASTYADVVNRITHSVSMGEQLTFIKNKSAAYEYHRNSNRNVPDENYARENLQLHQIGLPKLHEDGSLMLDRYGKPIPNYNQDVSSIKSNCLILICPERNLTLLASSTWKHRLAYLFILENFHWFEPVISPRKLQRP